MTPSEGLQVGELYIPGNVNLIIPPHVLHLGKSCVLLETVLSTRQVKVANELQMSDTSSDPLSSCQSDGLPRQS